MLCAGGNQVDACGFDAAVAQQVSQFGNVPAGSVEDRGKQVPQIVRKHFSRLHACVLAQPFQFRPDLAAAKFLSAFGAKDRAGSGFLFLGVLQQLATELSRRSTGKTCYILDEPTTGLHSYDVDKLVKILQRLRGAGNTVIVIEHNLDVIKVADHIIDLGPEGGDGGGTIVTEGTPEQVAQCEASFTGQFLKKIL